MMERFYSGVIARTKSEEGASAVEYGVMVALIAAEIIGTVAIAAVTPGTMPTIGGQLNTAFPALSTALSAASEHLTRVPPRAEALGEPRSTDRTDTTKQRRQT